MYLKDFVEFLANELEQGEKDVDRYEVVIKSKNGTYTDTSFIDFKNIKVDLELGHLIIDVTD